MNDRHSPKIGEAASARTSSPERRGWLPGPLRLAYEYLVFYLGYLYFGVGCALCSLFCAVMHPLLPAHIGTRLGRWVTGSHFRGFLAFLKASQLVRLDLAALDTLRDQPTLILAPNHPSLLDAVLVISRLPQAACIMKAQIWDNVFLGGGARLSGYIRNDSPVNLVRQSTRELRAGHQLLVFPEGTRTREGPINAFRGGFALMAKKAGAEVQTIFIETESNFLSKGWPLLRKPQFPLVYRARLGKRFRVTGEVQAFVSELEDYYRQELRTPAPPPPPTAAPAPQPVAPRALS